MNSMLQKNSQPRSAGLVCGATLILILFFTVRSEAYVPPLDAAKDAYGISIGKGVTTYVVTHDIRAWHGTNTLLDDSGSKADYPIWLSVNPTNSLAAAIKKLGGAFVRSLKANSQRNLVLYEMTVPKGNYVLLPANAARGLEIAREKRLMVSGRGTSGKKNLISEPLMANPPDSFRNNIKDSGFCVSSLNGWRSPWDQNEFMVCPQKKTRIERRQIVFCNIYRLIKYAQVISQYEYLDPLVAEKIAQFKASASTSAQAIMLQESQRRAGGFRAFDIFLANRLTLAPVGLEELIEQKICARCPLEQREEVGAGKDAGEHESRSSEVLTESSEGPAGSGRNSSKGKGKRKSTKDVCTLL